MSRRTRGIALAIATVCSLLAFLPPATSAGPATRSSANAVRVPVYAYFYQWYTTGSWRRAKIDYPLVGRYSSDDLGVLRQQVAEAQRAGLNGFLTSWKSTPALDRRLKMLLQVARARDFDVGVVYEGLNFQRKPLPISVVRSDLVMLVHRWGKALRSRYFGKPVVIWTGIDQFSLADVRSVRRALGDRVDLLASAKSVPSYQRVARLVDGDAYYWSSANPGTAYTRDRLAGISAAVHARHGIWLAPATAGFDARPLGHTRVIPREGGRTLFRSLGDAFGSRPQAVGVISWNEWSENTYIEPGRRYGAQELDVLRTYLQRRRSGAPIGSPASLHIAPVPPSRPTVQPKPSAVQPALAADPGGWTGLRAGLLLAAGSCAAAGLWVLRLYAWRRTAERRPRPRHSRGIGL